MAATYRSPGVYITEVPNPAVGSLPNGFRLPGLVATGNTTFPVPNTTVTKGTVNGTDAIPTGGFTLVDVSQVGDTPSTSQYIRGTDFNLVNGNLVWLPTGQQPSTGAIYYVSWKRAKVSTDYLPIMYTNIRDVRSAYGFELSNGVVNPISTAADLMFQNGAPAIVIAQALTAAVTDIQTAVTAMGTQDIDVLVVPQSTNTTLTQFCRNSVLTQSSSALHHERIFITSADGFSDATTTIVAKAVLNGLDRFWMVVPPAFDVILQDAVTLNNQLVFLQGGYLAAAYAGVVCNPNADAATPLTRRSVAAITDLSSFNYLDTDMNFLSQNGVTVIQSAPGGFQVRHAVTTDTTNVNTFTASIRLIEDFIRKTLRPLLDKTYIGTKITSQTPSKVVSTITTYLTQQIANEIIVRFQGISVTQDTIDPRTLNVSFSIKPVYPCEFVDVSFSLLLS